jgi:hypothetical protein
MRGDIARQTYQSAGGVSAKAQKVARSTCQSSPRIIRDQMRPLLALVNAVEQRDHIVDGEW